MRLGQVRLGSLRSGMVKLGSVSLRYITLSQVRSRQVIYLMMYFFIYLSIRPSFHLLIINWQNVMLSNQTLCPESSHL